MFANNEELSRVYRLLTGKNGFFDQDKVDIINCEKSVDIKACPGSGKTTTLLAKLVLLANKMPLLNGKGICVLTYTNVAIDEIKSKLGHKADVLFSYPNYFGTMQTFVDDFFASAALQYYYGSRISLVDNDRSNEEMYHLYKQLGRSKLANMLYHSVYNTLFRISSEDIDLCGGKELLQKNRIIKNSKGFILIGKNSDFAKLPRNEFTNTQIQNLYKIRKEKNTMLPPAEDEALISFIQSSKADFFNGKILYQGGKFVNLQNETAQEFISIKEDLLKKGILKFYDSYNLSLRLMNDFPCLKEELAKRFEYLFVDEMQDTKAEEFEFLNTAFDKNKIKVQYFGDEDQAIYQNKVVADQVWKAHNPLEINMSKRFGQEIATVISPFRVKASSPLSGNPEIQSLKPILIVYDNPKMVLHKFAEILQTTNIVVGGHSRKLLELANEQRAKDSLHRYNIKAVGWTGCNKDSAKLSIQSYYEEFTKSKAVVKRETCNLQKYIHNKGNTTYQSIVSNLISGVLEFLRIADIHNGQRYFTKQSLFDFLENHSSSTLVRFKELIAQSAAQILNGDTITPVRKISDFFHSDFHDIFGYEVNIISSFCKVDVPSLQINETCSNDTINVFKANNIEIKIDTVHSVKGETHLATLYMETFYHTGCESENLWEQFKGNVYNPSNRDSIKRESLKIAYVAMSRPRYLLCVAISKDHFVDCVEIRNLWNVVFV